MGGIMFKTIRNFALVFVVIVILCFSLMVVTYTLPTDNAYESIVADADLFSNLHFSTIPGYDTTSLDLYSDSIILSEICYYNHNVSLFDNSMSNYGTRDGHDFGKFVGGNESVIKDYARYWHGNLVVLKVLFLFLDYNAIKLLELFFEVVMFIFIVKLMYGNNLKNYIIPFILSLFLIHPEVIGLSMQYFAMFNIMLISVCILLKFKEKLFKNNRLLYYFLAVGMLANFFDLTTYPLITLGIPAIFYLLLEKDQNSIKQNVIKILLFGIVWSVGFIGMWISKWIISSIILNKNVVANALEQFSWRVSSAEFSRFDAILANVLIYHKKVYLIIFVLIGIYYIKRLINARNKITLDGIKQIAPFLCIALMPFAWYFVLSNHSYIHFWFTYRDLLIFFFAVMCSLEYLIIKTCDNC